MTYIPHAGFCANCGYEMRPVTVGLTLEAVANIGPYYKIRADLMECAVSRVVEAGRYGSLVVTCTREGLVLREKGRRKAFGPLTWSALYERAQIAEADAAIARRRRVRRGVIGGAGAAA